jgi:hypothetical protein
VTHAAERREPPLEVIEPGAADERRAPDDRCDRRVDARLQRLCMLAQADKRAKVAGFEII